MLSIHSSSGSAQVAPAQVTENSQQTAVVEDIFASLSPTPEIISEGVADTTNEGKDPFAQQETTNDPFADKEVANDPFEEKEVANDPFADKEVANDPFEEKETTNDPFADKEATNDPFEEKETTNDPFADKEATNDPFEEKETTNDPFEEKETTNDPFADKEAANDPFAEKETISNSAEKENTPSDPLADKNDDSLANPFVGASSTTTDLFSSLSPKPDKSLSVSPSLSSLHSERSNSSRSLKEAANSLFAASNTPILTKSSSTHSKESLRHSPSIAEQISMLQAQKDQLNPFASMTTHSPLSSHSSLSPRSPYSQTSSYKPSPSPRSPVEDLFKDAEVPNVEDIFSSMDIRDEKETEKATDEVKENNQIELGDSLDNPFVQSDDPMENPFMAPDDSLDNIINKSNNEYQLTDEKNISTEPDNMYKQQEQEHEQHEQHEQQDQQEQEHEQHEHQEHEQQEHDQQQEYCKDSHQSETYNESEESFFSDDSDDSILHPLDHSKDEGESPETSKDSTEAITDQKKDKKKARRRSIFSIFRRNSILTMDTPEDTKLIASRIGVDLPVIRESSPPRKPVQTVDIVDFFENDDEFNETEEDGKRLRVIFDNMLPIVNNNPVIPEPEEMEEQVVCKARALLTMLASMNVGWRKAAKKKLLEKRIYDVTRERCYSEIGYDIRVCEK